MLKEERETSKLLQQKYDELSGTIQPASDRRYREEVQVLKNDMLKKDSEITKLREQLER